MSKAAGKNRPLGHQRQETVQNSKLKTKNSTLIFVLIAILAAIPFGLGKYIEFNTPGPYDSGAYIYSAKHILDGAKIGVEEKPSAQSGTLLVNMLGVWLCGFNETGPEVIQTILQAAALLLMFIAMAKLFGRPAAAVGVIVASVYLSAPLIAKFGNVKEQYMIAVMIIGMSCFVLRQLDGKWWWAVLSGVFVVWAPLFKQTGVSAIAAIGLFVIAQPFLKHRTWKQTGIDILLLLAGAAISIAPAYLWLASVKAPTTYWPYSFVWKMLPSAGASSTGVGSYISQSRQISSFSQQWPRVLRYYSLLILPIALATGAIIARIARMIWNSHLVRHKVFLKRDTRHETRDTRYDRFVLLFAIWWLLDMAFIWISPRSYEQYYLPLNASAAMLGGYLIAVYNDKLKSSENKIKWRLIGLVGFICMMTMSWHIFFGIEKSPHSGTKYPEKRRGYLQKLNMAANYRKGARGYWEIAGEYIHQHSAADDKIYVWGWVPGIYVKAQRLSSAPKAFEGTMHTLSPKALSERIDELLTAFEKQPPKFIVDTHKKHFPWDRPPLELWPRTPKGFLPADKRIVDQYNKTYSEWIRDNIGEDEALRYEAMQPFRKFVMKNYKIVQKQFGQHVLFEWKGS